MAKARSDNLFRTVLRGGFKQLFKFMASSRNVVRPLHRNEAIEPFFIIGSGRSGNTLMRRILNNHSELFIPPETYVLGSVIKLYTLLPFVSWRFIVNAVYNKFSKHPEFKTFNMVGLEGLKKKAFLCEKKDQSLAFLVNGFYEEYRDQQQISSTRWGDKTPLNTISLEEINCVFPMSKYIHMRRSPYDVIASYLNAGIYKNVEDAFLRWLNSEITVESFRLKHPAKIITIEYDELVTKSEVVVDKVCEFLGIAFSIELLSIPQSGNKHLGDVEAHIHHRNVLDPINVSSIGKGLLQLTQVEKDWIKVMLKKNNMDIWS